jgi:glycosyltransferase involved in cell wall biosynthesis
MTSSPATDAGQRKIRVLLLSDELEVGGTQRQIVHIARSLDRSRFEPTVGYFRNRSFLVEQLEQAGVPVSEIPKRSRIDPAFVLNLRRFLLDGRFDVMHCFAFGGELWGAVGRRLLPPAKRPALITSVRNKYDWYSGLQWRLKRWSAMQSTFVIANSHAGGEHARATMGMPAGSVDVVYNGVGDAPEAAAAQPASTRGGPVTALFVGRLVEQKNVPVLLRAMKRLRDSGTDLKLQVAGDGPLRGLCEQTIAELQIGDWVALLGERSDVPALMADADFVVLPSLREGLSNVILEAMMVGRPVIASAVGGSVELVEHMESGLLFPSDDDAALADALRLMAGDRALREKCGARGRQRTIEQFTVPAMVRTMQDFYTRCAAKSPTYSNITRG